MPGADVQRTRYNPTSQTGSFIRMLAPLFSLHIRTFNVSRLSTQFNPITCSATHEATHVARLQPITPRDPIGHRLPSNLRPASAYGPTPFTPLRTLIHVTTLDICMLLLHVLPHIR